MKDLGMPLETIAKVTGMSVVDIAELQAFNIPTA